MSEEEGKAKLTELINSINALANLVNTVQSSISHLTEQISTLDKKIADLELDSMNQQISELKATVAVLPEIQKGLGGLSAISDLQSQMGLLSELPSVRNMLAVLDSKIDKITTTPTPAATVSTTPAPVKSSEILDPSPAVKETPPAKKPEPAKEDYVSPGLQEEEAVVSTADADHEVTLNAIRNKFKHISQMISPQSVAASIKQLLEELRDEVESTVGMSPMLFELNKWIQKVDRMKENEPLLPDVHSELVEKLDDWLERIIAKMTG